MGKGLVKFDKIRYTDHNRNRVQAWGVNLITKKKVLLSFNHPSKMYFKVCRIGSGRAKFTKPLTIYISWSDGFNNNVREIKGKELQEFTDKYAEFMV